MNILIASVGGQGGLTLAHIIAYAALLDGKEAVVGETLGMSQRFGSVAIHVRIEEGKAPIIPLREADMLIGMEAIESLRYSDYLKDNGLVILNRRIMKPVVASLKYKTPSMKEIEEFFSSFAELVASDYTKIAEDLGNPRGLNVVMLAEAYKHGLPLSKDSLEEAIATVIRRHKEKNLEMFRSLVE